MHYAKLHSAQTSLLEAHIIDIEVDISRGLHSFSIVGLPDKAVEESKDRIAAAIKNAGFKSPKQTNQKIVISLAPADLKKEGPSFDIGMAVGYLLASENISFNPAGKLFLGELSLDGRVRKISGTLPLVIKAKEKGFSEIYLPEENAKEASLIDGIDIFPIKTLQELVFHLDKKMYKADYEIEDQQKITPYPHTKYTAEESHHEIDFSDVKGQESAKRALEISAAGRHNIAMYGPAGTGKTLLAKAFGGILPPLSFQEAIEVTSIHSISGTLQNALISEPPFRAPHHSSSYTALVGGGAYPRPGEVTLAHKGVLFLDEFAEFERRVIDALRQPLENREVSIARTKGRAVFPADFILIAALNPCPCGNYNVKDKVCICSSKTILDYKRKISGPIIDRIDMWVEVSKVDHDHLLGKEKSGNTSKEIKERVLSARNIQEKRFKNNQRGITTNSQMNANELISSIELSKNIRELLYLSAQRLDLSARAHHRVVKVARTIADLENAPAILEKHVLEALQYRPKTEL